MSDNGSPTNPVFAEMTAWSDMLAMIGAKNSLLADRLARDSRPTRSAAHNSGLSIIGLLEQERSRIARDLHAGAGQPIAGIKLNLEMLEDCAAALPLAGRAALTRINTLTEQALDQVRAVSHGLHPPEWQALTIGDALRFLVGSSGLADRIQVDLDIQPLPFEPSQAVKIALYRCAQECLSNVARHSRATRLVLSLAPKGPGVELRLHDNGSGFRDTSTRDAQAADMQPDGTQKGTRARRRGIGLVAIREHAAALGGFCEISSGPRGVEIRVELPVEAE